MKTCQTCLKENKSNYNDICQTCYNEQWFKKNGPRQCANCSKSYKGFGINCSSCAKKIRDTKRIGIPCSECKRTSVKILNREFLLCTTCFRKKKEKEIPGFREKRILYNRQSHRKYRGRQPIGPLQKNQAGTGHINKSGYKIITKVGHPNANEMKGAIPEHVFIMSKHIGRALMKGETVHHKNGIRHDNRIENLELWTIAQPCGQRHDDKIKYCIDYLLQYDYKVIDPESVIWEATTMVQAMD